MGIRVLIASHIRLYREALGRILEQAREQISLVGVAESAPDAMEQIARLTPDIALLDMAMGDAFSVARQWGRMAATASDSTRIVALGMAENEAEVLNCAQLGIAGFITRDASITDMLEAIEATARGEVHCSPKIAGSLFRRVAALSSSRRAASNALTARESQILRLLQQGMSNKMISRSLGIELPTVKNHVHSILGKLGIHAAPRRSRFCMPRSRAIPDISRRRHGSEDPGRPESNKAGSHGLFRCMRSLTESNAPSNQEGQGVSNMSRIQQPAAFAVGLLLASAAHAQTDPGVRPGAVNGQAAATTTSPLPLASVTANTPQGVLEFFDDGLDRFQEVDNVSGGTAGTGLGPRFNFNQCAACHSQPTFGGSSPANNPEAAVISAGIVSAGTNSIPSFITANGPTREARFPFFFNANGTANTSAPNGGVEDLYTVSGRADAGACSLQQPSFATAQAANNLIFRIPTPVFGAGLVENIDDSTLLNNQSAQTGNGLGISGTFNRNGNDGTIARFGWKAQNKSLELFAGEAYNVEMGISNEIFPQERPLPGEEFQGSGLPANCLNLAKKGYPEDITNFAATTGSDQFATNASIPSDLIAFTMFMKLLAPPTPSTTVPGGATSISHGSAVFKSIGCSVCHTPTIGTTQASNVTPSLGNAAVAAFSDFEIHHMGTGLNDNVSQGNAGGDQFRTAPLWGVGQRIFFLHDGRTGNLLTAIRAHASSGSEANAVVSNFNSLSAASQQDVLNFLRSL